MNDHELISVLKNLKKECEFLSISDDDKEKQAKALSKAIKIIKSNQPSDEDKINQVEWFLEFANDFVVINEKEQKEITIESLKWMFDFFKKMYYKKEIIQEELK